jgi:hypothetical protein
MTVGRIPVIEGGIQPTIFDAKADLLTATANDTPARLAVGSDYGFLQALASESTGLLWNNAAWTTYTPNLAATAGTFTSATVTGKYTRIGKLCIVQNRVAIVTNGTAAGQVIVSAPFAAKGTFQTMFVGAGRENAATGNSFTARLAYGDSDIYLSGYNGAYPGGNSYTLDSTLCYEVA